MARGVGKLRLVHPTGEDDAHVLELARLVAEISPPGAQETPREAPGAERDLPRVSLPDEGIGPLRSDRTPLVVAVLSFFVAVAIGIGIWIVLQDSPVVDVNRRFDEDTAVLPRGPSDSEEHKALLRAVRPDLVPPDSVVPKNVPDRAAAPSSEEPKGAAAPSEPAPDTVKAPEEPDRTERSAPAEPQTGQTTRPPLTLTPKPDRDDGSASGRTAMPPESAPERQRTGTEPAEEKPSVRAPRNAGVRRDFRGARAAMDRRSGDRPSAPATLTLPDSLKPIGPP